MKRVVMYLAAESIGARNGPPPPSELVLFRHLGEGGRMLVAGGLLDQPVKWFNVTRAGYIESVYKAMAKDNFADLYGDAGLKMRAEIQKIQGDWLAKQDAE